MVEYLLGEGGRNITGTVLTVDAPATPPDCRDGRLAPSRPTAFRAPLNGSQLSQTRAVSRAAKNTGVRKRQVQSKTFRISSCRGPRLTVRFPCRPTVVTEIKLTIWLAIASPDAESRFPWMYPLRVSQQGASEVHNMRDDAFVMTHWKRPSHPSASQPQAFPDQARYAAADEQRAMKARMEALHP